MASEFRRLLEAQQISGSKSQDREQWFDAGAYKQLNVEFFLLSAGTTSSPSNDSFKLTLQHASVMEDAAFVDLTDKDGNTVEVEMVVTPISTGPVYRHVEGFLRYIRWTAKTACRQPSQPASSWCKARLEIDSP